MKISIIIPTKEEGKYLEETLKQYLSIKKKYNLEIIVSDAGSKDNTVKIARKFADKVVVAKNGKEQNIPIGRNAGAKIATGDILFNTDADVFIPDKDKFFSEVIEAFKDESTIAVITKLKIFPSEEKLFDKIYHNTLNFLVKNLINFGAFLSKGECQIVRVESFRKIKGYNEKIVSGEDHNLFYRLRKIGKIKYLNDLVIYHSPRTFRKYGYVRLLFIYSMQAIYLIFKKDNYIKEWKIKR